MVSTKVIYHQQSRWFEISKKWLNPVYRIIYGESLSLELNFERSILWKFPYNRKNVKLCEFHRKAGGALFIKIHYNGTSTF
jgi:hypothetical protein